MAKNEQAPSRQDQAQEVIYQNRLDYLKSEHDRLLNAKDALQSDIDKKSKDYELFMGQRDAESKRLRADVLAAQEQLQKDKAEFQIILKEMQDNKTEFNKEKVALEMEKGKVTARMEAIGHFIQAVQRDISVLGL